MLFRSVQGLRTLDRQEGGLGLGLAIARSLVEQHGGQIDAHSDGPGEGTTITVTLPASTASAQPVAGTPRAAVPHSRAVRILVVDDNADAADMLAMFLSTAGHHVVTASDGPQALDVLRTFAPDVAVLDIGLPVMDGYELARRLRELLGNRAPLLIAVTGYGQAEDAQRSRDAGFAHHLVKPVDGDTLLALLASVAPRQEARSALSGLVRLRADAVWRGPAPDQVVAGRSKSRFAVMRVPSAANASRSSPMRQIGRAHV